MDNTLLNGYNPNTVFIGYSPNDFFYANAVENGSMPSDASCKSEFYPHDTHWDISCNNQNFQQTTNSDSCIKKELCKNKDYSNKLYNINQGNASSDEKYYDIKDEYDKLFMDTINLGIGCLFLLIFIFKNR